MSRKLTRPSPSESAKNFKIGTFKKGNDGNMWVIVETTNGVKKWARKPSLRHSNNVTLKEKENTRKSRKSRKSRNSFNAKSRNSKKDRHDLWEENIFVPYDEIENDPSTQIILNMADHIIEKTCKKKLSWAYTIRKLENMDLESFKNVINKIDKKAIEHPFSSGKVFDIIHPSHYPFIKGISVDHDGKIFKDKYQAFKKNRRPGFFIETNFKTESKFRWLPTIYEITKTGITQKSYINDLFDIPENTKKEISQEIAKLLRKAIELFKDLATDMKVNVNFMNTDLHIIVKVAYYKLKPNESHEGVWHVEGVPDEHIIMSAICYYEDDFSNTILEFRRDRTPEEMQTAIMIPEQNASIIGGYEYSYQHLGYLRTEKNTMYAWVNACQHRLMKIVNDSNKIKYRKFITFFLVDPSVKIISTKDIPEQKFSSSKANKYMKKLMMERKKVKIELNKSLEKEISYCEH